ncbi:DUF2142 domain-containing protein [Terrimesophilobacter mesophilus]|uniref:DUF2142 domain-containing protein n=1 Tax=Terrimesophilobacter mesophilus TaxID=433647 RepID=A0A4V3IA81_9MICO|nr:DUF2142 domain-containing protein [Terrimesophilobacter mesophilus]
MRSNIGGRGIVRKLRAIHFAPAFAIVALLAWAFASPIGAAPDDDYHLVSTWCAVVDGTECAAGTSAATRSVPEALVDSICYAQKPEVSASCQDGIDFTGTANTVTKRGNFSGGYPPVYYAVMHTFVGHDVEVSALVMRFVNILIFVGLITGLFLLLPPERRPTLIWPWVIGSVPMGMFLLASNNPSAWAIMGVGTGWLALLGYLETSGWRKWSLGGVAAIATVLAAGSRGDAAVYAIMGIGAVFLLTVPRGRRGWKRYALDAILPVVLVIAAALLFLTARQTAAGLGGFSGGTGGSLAPGAATADLNGFGRFAYNFLNIPFLWAGNFGQWGLGWLDTSMPAIVSYGTIASLVAVGFVALRSMWGRKLVVVLAAGATLWILPVYVLTAGGDIVGEQVQPRYMLPLILLLIGLVMLTRKDRGYSLSRPQLILVIATLSIANLIALHMNIRRYVTGIDAAGWNLDAGAEWWWHIPFSPMTVWAIGSLAFAATVYIVVREVSWPGRQVSSA